MRVLLRSAGLRPTAARVAVMQALAGQDEAVTVEELYRAMIQRPEPPAVGTVYRAIQGFEKLGLVLCERRRRATMYRLRPADMDDPRRIRLLCRDSGRVVLLDAPGLHAHLLAAAKEAGFDLAAQVLRIEVDGLKALARDTVSRRRAAPPFAAQQAAPRMVRVACRPAPPGPPAG